MPNDFELSVEATDDAWTLLSLAMRLGKVNADGTGQVEIRMGLKQGLALNAQLQLISRAQEALRQFERALLTGDTTGRGPITGGKA